MVERELRLLPAEIVPQALSICSGGHVAEAFCVRRELINFKKVQLTKKLHSGEPINLRETYLHGAALLVDLSMRACEAWSRRPGRRIIPSLQAAHP